MDLAIPPVLTAPFSMDTFRAGFPTHPLKPFAFIAFFAV
jgi:hypothetical protein